MAGSRTAHYVSGQCPACLFFFGWGGGGWLLTRVPSPPSSSTQGSLPQPPPVDVDGGLPVLLSVPPRPPPLSLAIPQASTAAVNGEDPGICRAGLSLRREAEALLELVLETLILGRSPISRGRRWGTGATGTRDRVLTFSSTILSALYPMDQRPVSTFSPTILSTLYPRASESQEDNVFLSLPYLDQSGVLAGCGTQFVL